MNEAPTTHITGDAAVQRDAVIAGNAKIRGNATIDHSLRVKGWLDAKNIKDTNKGLFKSVSSLQQKYPNPEAGWWALVGDNVPAQLYVCEDGKWVGRVDEHGGPLLCGAPAVDTSDYFEEVNYEINRIEDTLAKKADLAILPEMMIDATNISVTAGTTDATVTFATADKKGNKGTKPVTIPGATDSEAGLYAPAERRRIDQSVSDCNESIEAVSGRVTVLEGRVHDVETKADGTQTIVTNELRPAIQELKDKDNAIDEVLGRHDTDITSLSTRLDTTDGNVAKNAENIAKNTAHIAVSDALIEQNKELFEDFKVNDFSNLSVQVDKNTSGIAKNTADIAQNTKDVAFLKNWHNENYNKIADFESDIAQLNNSVNTNQRNISQNIENITSLQSTVNTLGRSVEQINDNVNDNADDIARNAGDIRTLNTHVNNVDASIVNLGARTTALETTVDAHRTTHESDMTGVWDHIIESDSKLQRASEDILSLNAKHAQFNLNGYYDSKGAVVDALLNGKEYVRTGLIPIDRNNAITVNTAGDAKTAQLVFFDAQGQVLEVASLNSLPVDGHFKVTQVAASAIPDKAVYFATCTTLELKNSSSYSNGDTVEDRSCTVSDAIQRSKKLLFIDQWKSLDKVYHGALKFGYDTELDRFNLQWAYPNDKSKKYMPSVTYEEAMVMMGSIPGEVLGYDELSVIAPANLPPMGHQLGTGPYLHVMSSEVATYNASMQVLILAAQQSGTVSILQNPMTLVQMPTLKAIIGVMTSGQQWNPIQFSKGTGTGFPKLEFFRVLIKQSFDVRTSPLLTLDTMQYLVTYAQNTSPITVTVHPDVYAKISGPDEDTPGGVRSYLPLNLADGNISNKSANVALIDNGVEITRQNMDVMFRMTLGRTIPIVKGKKYTLSMDVEGMSEGDNYYLLINELAGGATNAAGVINLYNGRPTAVFTAQKDTKVSELTFDDFDRTGLDKDATSKIKITNIRLSAGEYEALPYVAPPSKIEDEQLREQVYWASLLDEAALKNITFATTE